MKRRGFILNSAVLILLIPMLLLLATYEDVSSQIFQAQNERVLVERSFRGVAYFDSDFQRALEISGKRALIAVIDYVTVTGEFIKQKTANETLKDLILFGTSEELSGYENLETIMQNQTIARWLALTRDYLLEQGFLIEQSDEEILNNINLTVGVLDSFTIFVKARIPNITVRDFNGKIVYSGSIPKSGNYTYAFIDIRNLEDPLFPPMTGGRYSRSIRACLYPYPELIGKPIKVLEGNGSSDKQYLLGNFSRNVNKTYIYFGDFYPGDGALAYVLLNGSLEETDRPIIVNTSIGGISISPVNVFNESDAGVLVFGKSNTGDWKNTSLQYRLNITVTNEVGVDLTNYQIPILISSIKGLSSSVLTQLFTNTQTDGNSDIYRVKVAIDLYDENGNRIPFWVEYWDTSNQEALIWIKDSINAGQSKTYSLYFGSGTPVKGYNYEDGLFIFFDDFEDGTWNDKWIQVEQSPTESNGELIINGGDNVEAVRTNDLNYDGSYAVRFRMSGTTSSNNKDWDNGIGVEDSTDSSPNLYWVVYFTDDTRDQGNTLVVHEGDWWNRATTASSNRAGKPTDFHVYEAYMRDTGAWYDYNTKIYDAKFRDLTDSRINYDSYNRLIDPPSLRYLYLVNDNGESGNKGVYDFIFIRKYPDTNGDSLEDSTNFSGISLSSSDVESYTPPAVTPQILAKAYDLQPFLSCLLEQMYFGVYNGWSIFERLEGSYKNHENYEELANKTQDELGISYENKHYPIGLVSFLIPHDSFDSKLSTLFTSGLTARPLKEGQSSADYYFLQYYFGNGNETNGYRMWGVSYGTLDTPYFIFNPPVDLSFIPFFLDNQTALSILGKEAACDLLEGYTCS